MSEWISAKLADVAEIIMGQSPPGDTCNNSSGTPLLNGPTEFTDKHPLPVQYTTDPKKVSCTGDILFCVRGSTTGRMNWSDQKYAIGRGIAAIRHKTSAKANAFIKGVMEINLEELLNAATGSTFPNVSKTDLENIEILLPSLPEQEAIAEVISSLDDKIDMLYTNNKTLEQLAETIFRQWFVEESENAMPGKLGDIIDIHDSKRIPLSSTQREQLKEGDVLYPYYGAASVMDHINQFIFDGDFLLIGEDGTVQDDDGYPIIQRAIGKCWINNHAHVLTAVQPFTVNYLELLMRNTSISHIVTGAVQPKINQGSLRGIEIIIPPYEDVERFNLIVDPLMEKRNKNILQIKQLETLRDTLLPKLISGTVRVTI